MPRILITIQFLMLLFITAISHAASPPAVPRTGQATCYDTAGVVIPCTGTGQDGELQMGVAWPNPRFLDNNDQTMPDKLTGLIWSKDANPAGSTKTWQQALDYIKTLNSQNYQGHSEWRLPNINELQSLVNQGQLSPVTWLNGQGFSNVQASGYYWSGSTNANSTNVAWVVDDGYVGGSGKASYSPGYVWPVHSGQSGSFGSLTLSKTGQTTCYDTSGTVIYCLGTRQDGELQVGASWPSPRFLENADQTVTDNLTGLIWTKDGNPAAVYKTWQQALDYIKTLNSGNYLGHNDWRLPNVNELESLINKGQASSATWLNGQGQGFSNVQSNNYWSSSTNAQYTAGARVVYMKDGYVTSYDKTGNFYVWPVRSGQSGAFDSNRFTDNSNGTVTDSQTGLVWLKNANCTDTAGSIGKSSATLNWYDAKTWSSGLSSGTCGLTDGSTTGQWRLPTLDDWRALVDTTRNNPPLPLGHPFSNVQANFYWSSDTVVTASGYSYPDNAWCANMYNYSNIGGPLKNSNSYVWPVRSGTSGPYPSFLLTVNNSGTGEGNVTSTTGGFSCGSTCSASITSGTSVTLIATSSVNGSTFTGWSGSCSGTGACTVIMDAAKSVTATFAGPATNGTCGSSNGSTFTVAPTTNLCTTGTASSLTGSGPWNWSCAGTSGGTTATCAASKTATPTYTITSSVVSGNGTLTCTSPVNSGATSTCTVTPSTGYQLATFTDNSVDKKSSVSGNSYSIPNVTANHAIAATFSLIPATPVNGTCGSSNGGTLAIAPTANLCAAGTASTVTGAGPWSWTCAGTNGGTTANCAASSSAVNLTSGLVAYYPFSGNSNDTSGNGNNATVYGATLTADRSGNQNSAYAFNGSSYIQTPVSSNSKPLSFSVWFKPDVATGNVAIVDSDISTQYGHSLYIADGAASSRNLSIEYHNGLYNTAFTLNAGQWYHAVVVLSDTMKLYVNGVQVASSLYSGTTFDGSTFRLGRHNAADPWFFTGAMDDARFYNRAITSAEVTALYQEQVTAPAVNGTCGTSANSTLPTAPTTNLCTTGTASSVTGAGPWSWTCAGTSGGTTANCSANKTVQTLSLIHI